MEKTLTSERILHQPTLELNYQPFVSRPLCQHAFSLLQQSLVDRIVKTANPDMIFLLGTSFCRRKGESIFNQPMPASSQLSTCFLLVLISDLLNKELHHWQDKIENHCKHLLPITTLVLQTGIFEQWLWEGHLFAQRVWQSAAPVYNSGNRFLTAPPAFTNTTTNKDYERKFREGLTKTKEFLAGSELYRTRKQQAMAAFMLHQSAEQALRTLLKAGTGYHASTHSLDRLLRYTSLIACQFSDVFPQTTQQEKRLFTLLQKAYIHTRYKEGYTVSNDDLVCLTEKVWQIHEIVAAVGKTMFGVATGPRRAVC